VEQAGITADLQEFAEGVASVAMSASCGASAGLTSSGCMIGQLP
jgi:hypothetical protein